MPLIQKNKKIPRRWRTVRKSLGYPFVITISWWRSIPHANSRFNCCGRVLTNENEFNDTIRSFSLQRRPSLARCPMPVSFFFFFFPFFFFFCVDHGGSPGTQEVPIPVGTVFITFMSDGKPPKQKQKSREEFGSFFFGWQGGGKIRVLKNVPTAPLRRLAELQAGRRGGFCLH